MEEIEREIKENIMKYEIKTTSNDILNKMKKKKFSFKLPIIISTSFALACSVLLVVLIPSIVNNKPLFIENTSNKLNDRSLLSSLSLQMNIGEIFNNNSSSNIRKAKKDITNDDFIYCVDKIENIIPIYEDFLTNKDGIKYIFKEEKFSYQNNVYKYQLITDNMSSYDKIKAIHDYIINTTVYDQERANAVKNSSEYVKYKSNTAYGPLIEGKAICGGYTDAMALFLDKMGIPNYKVSSEKHIWNLVYIDGAWKHLDLTWDDPVVSTGENMLLHTFFLIDSTTLMANDATEHTYNKNIYIEAN